MRVLLNVEIDTARGNELMASGTMGEQMGALLARLRPETAYFYARGGCRALTLVVDAADSASLAGLAEPFWNELHARVEAIPCMNADELAEGLRRLA